ncbi:hypothetical protein CWC22_007895 [Pseudoalteromonas rubra]|uniref:Uncharacterized protein n=1 Tax=Pseudoalteromonas rubra TaxID=43658 RepID=A0A5S3UU72_9GAMM|nr:hypothetical protein [Pseudoalteromonas rubra]QPB82914.1 hypothetical protein CWC22_007895 [Pseudoalteromonas rubra]
MAFRPDNGSPQEKKKLGNGVDSLHHTTKRMLNFEKKVFHDLESFERTLDAAISSEGTDQGNQKSYAFEAYKKLYEHHQKLSDEETLITRMERNAQIRNVLFRSLTTLAIGFSIMLVYFVAHKLEIPMPLLRIGVS